MFGQPGHLDLGGRGQGGVVQLGREGPEGDLTRCIFKIGRYRYYKVVTQEIQEFQKDI